MKLGDLVKVIVDEVEYLAKLVSYDVNSQKWGCSIYALGKVVVLDSSDIETV